MISTPLSSELELGIGIYSFPEAARIVGRSDGGASVRQLQHWIKSGLTPVTHVVPDGTTVITFKELVSLELISRFRKCDVSLQRIRRFEAQLRQAFPEVARPFASNIFFTDGVAIWAKYGDDDPERAIELVGKRPGHFVWVEVIRSFADQIEYDATGQAASWTLNEWVEIRPAVQFGRPIVRGTRIPVETIEANLRAGSVPEVAEWYGLTVPQVAGVRQYLARAS